MQASKKGAVLVVLLSLVVLGGLRLLKGYAKWSAKHDGKSDTEESTSGEDPSAGRVTASTTAAGNTHRGSPITIEPEDPQWGDADAPVTMVQFGDLECPFCVRIESTIERIKGQYGPQKLRLIWKHKPLAFHKNARPLAEAAVTVLAVGGDFWKFRDLAYASRNVHENSKALHGWVTAAGIDAKEFMPVYEAKIHAAKVDRDLALGQALGVTGTPAFRINGKVLVGAQPFERFTEIIDPELAAADALRSTGVPREALSLELTKKNFAPPPPPR